MITEPTRSVVETNGNNYFRRPLISKMYKTKDLKEALKLAKDLKFNGRYNLFRGQAQHWQVVPTAGRLPPKELKEAEEKLKRLYYYFGTEPILNRFKSNIDWFFAIAQHYGIPTNYIDFTNSVEVAAYFATNSKSNKIGQSCEIICLNENDFNSFIKFTDILYKKKNVIPPYIARVNVDNLWRLQAQLGCFLFTPYANIESYYDFDRIIFPFNKPFEGLKRQDVYPEHKSELEILLDYYFNNEERLTRHKGFELFIEKHKIPVSTLARPKLEKLIKTNNIHFSWSSPIFARWNFPVREEWKKEEPNDIIRLNFSFNSNINIERQVEVLFHKLLLYSQNKPIARTKVLQFDVTAKPKLSKQLTKIINRSCTRIWDGTRNLPYSMKDIFNIISKYICLEIYENKNNNKPYLCKEDLITLELANEYGSVTRCKASPSKVTSAFRSDLKDILLVEELAQNINSKILLHINVPNLLFDFNRLINLFKEELILYQVWYNSENENPVIFYTPSQIKVMGYA